MRKGGTWIFLALMMALAGAISAQEGGFFVIKRPSAKERIAVPDFRPAPGLRRDDPSPAQLTGMMRETVKMTGLFDLIPPDSYPATGIAGGKDTLPAWRLINTDYLILGDVVKLEGKRYQVEFRLYDVRQEKMILGKRYTGEPELFNRMVLKFMDELIYLFTNKKSFLDSRIAYVSDVTGRNEIRVISTDGSNDQALTSNRTLNLSPAWSPDGRYLLYVGYRARNPDLYIVDIAKNTESKFYSASGLNIAGDFSPDGRLIAFCAVDRDANADIYMISREGRDLRRITTNPAIEVSPTWSPDGRLIAFVSDRTGSPQIYLLDLSRGAEGPNNQAVRITYEGSYNTSPSWSPDGRYIAYTGRVGGEFDLFLIEMTGQERTSRRLTSTPYNEEEPAWSPDSRFLVYDSNPGGNYDIYIMSVYGGEPRRITTKAAKERMPAWSPRTEQ